MPLVNCPTCQANLKVPEGMAGRKARCNKCQNVFVIPAGSAVTAPYNPPPPPGSYSERPSGRAGPPPTPQIAPHPSYEPPMDEGRPRRRSGPRPDEFDEEFAPRPRRRRRKKKGFPVLMVSLLAGGGVLLISVIVLLIFLLWPSGGASQDMIYMPDNAEVIAAVDMDEFMSSKVYRILRKEFPQMGREIKGTEREMGVKVDDMDTILMGAHMGFGADPVMALRTTKSYSADKIFSNMNREGSGETKVGSHTIHRLHANKGFCVVNSNLILYGRPNELKKILERNGRPRWSSDLKSAVSNANFSNTVVMVANINRGANMAGNPFGPGAFPTPKYASVELGLGSRVAITGNVFFKSGSDAKNVAQMINGFLAKAKTQEGMNKDVREIIDSVNISHSGNKLVASASFDAESISKAMGNIPFMPGGNPLAFLNRLNPQPPQPPVNPPINPPFNPPPKLGGKVVNSFAGSLRRGQRRSHNIFLNAGKTYTFEMNGTFDTYLRLYSPTNQMVRFDDDGGPGLNSRMSYSPPQSGNYRIEAGSFANSGQGAYTILVRE